MKRVVIDARMIRPVMHGIARYVDLLLRGLTALQAQKGLDYEVIVLISKELSGKKNWNPSFKKVICEAPFLSPKEWIEIPKILKKYKADLYHSPSFSSLPYCPVPHIVTVHDLCHLHFGTFAQKMYYQILLRKFCARAARVVTVSEFSRNEILQWIRLKEVSIVYNAIDPWAVSWGEADLSAAKDTLIHHGLTSGFLLCLSNPKAHKNASTLVQAFQLWHQKADYKESLRTELGLVGEGFESYSEGPGVRVLTHLKQKEILHLMMGARGFFFPSAYEGFGLPPVEAACVGLPLAVSDIQPHREGLIDLGASEVVWVKPYDVSSWVQAIQSVLQRPVMPPSPELRRKTLERFSVE